MFVKNKISSDPRVKGEALALKNAGHQVTVIGLMHNGYAQNEQWNGIRFLRIGYDKGIIGNLKKIYKMTFDNNNKGTVSGKKTLNSGHTIDVIKKKSRKTQIFNWLRYYAGFFLEPFRIRQWCDFATNKQYDVYHAHDLNTLEEAWLCARKTGAKLVYDSHELWLEWQQKKCKASKRLLRRWKRTELKACRTADMIITVSDGIARVLSQMYQFHQMPTVLYNCSDIRPMEESNRLRQEFLRTTCDRPIVLYQGGIQPGRGLELYIEIARKVRKADFVIIGPTMEATYQEKLRSKAEDLSNLYFLSPVPYDELWQITFSADIGYVFTEPVCDSYRLGLSNKIFEYMAAGLAILASDIDGHRELVSKIPGYNPVKLIPHDNSEEAALILARMLEDHQMLDRLKKNSRSLAEKYFNRQIEMKKLIKSYEQLL
jgi:glycosyltransferase involved in cell wall biosynthesis